MQHPQTSALLTKQLRTGGKTGLKLYFLHSLSPKRDHQTGNKLTGLVKTSETYNFKVVFRKMGVEIELGEKIQTLAMKSPILGSTYFSIQHTILSVGLASTAFLQPASELSQKSSPSTPPEAIQDQNPGN